MIRRAATNRVLNVLRHWVSKHSQVGGGGRRGFGLEKGGRWVAKPGSSSRWKENLVLLI